MMHRSLVLIALGFVALAQAAPLSQDTTWVWEQFKGIHEKTYRNENEEIDRRLIFERNLADIKEHNKLYAAGLVTYTKAVNKFTDMDISEILGGGCLFPNTTSEEVYVPGDNLEYDHKDWREIPGVVTEVKNQGFCGSCWAFAATGGLEGQWKLKKGVAVSLSEQQLVDCSLSFGNDGCEGGLATQAFEYIKAAGGIQSEKTYPYMAWDLVSCNFNKSKIVSRVAGFKRIPPGSEKKLTEAIAKVGPVSVGISATYNFAQYYQGVFSDPACPSTSVNHGVLAVGFGTDSRAGDYYIVKNSWGAYWGENGYIRMARNHGNMCKIASEASYPLV